MGDHHPIPADSYEDGTILTFNADLGIATDQHGNTYTFAGGPHEPDGTLRPVYGHVDGLDGAGAAEGVQREPGLDDDGNSTQ